MKRYRFECEPMESSISVMHTAISYIAGLERKYEIEAVCVRASIRI